MLFVLIAKQLPPVALRYRHPALQLSVIANLAPASVLLLGHPGLDVEFLNHVQFHRGSTCGTQRQLFPRCLLRGQLQHVRSLNEKCWSFLTVMRCRTSFFARVVLFPMTVFRSPYFLRGLVSSVGCTGPHRFVPSQST